MTSSPMTSWVSVMMLSGAGRAGLKAKLAPALVAVQKEGESLPTYWIGVSLSSGGAVVTSSGVDAGPESLAEHGDVPHVGPARMLSVSVGELDVDERDVGVRGGRASCGAATTTKKSECKTYMRADAHKIN